MESTTLPLVLVGLSAAVPGGLLLIRRVARVSALFLVLGGVGVVGAALLLASDRASAGEAVATGSVAVALVLAFATYPSLRWRHPVDFVALVVLVGAGLVSTAWPASREVQGLVQGTALLVHVWWRLETSRDDERRSATWMAAALALTSLLFGVLTFATETWGENPWLLTVFVLVGPAMYVGATLPGLLDVRSGLVSAVVTGVAVVTYVALFVLVMALLEAIGFASPSPGTTALVGALVAATFAPTQRTMRGVVEELLFGVRLDPLNAASAVADTVGDDPVRSLQAIRASLNLPYAALLVDGGTVVVSGSPPGTTRSFRLDTGAELVVGVRPGDQRLTGADEKVLALAVPLLTQALRARALAAEVVESRGRTIAAVEEERRRLRRELHDGLGPRLSGVAFTSDAARNLIRSDPSAAEAMVAQLRADTVIAIEEIRRMVYAMRPPALDELGLVPALRQQALGMRNRDGQVVAVTITASDLPELPAAVEVAAYRIVTEALANVARHSTSASATVRLDADATGLRLEICDRGSSVAWRPGVGLSSMHERAVELGGTLTAGPGPGGGMVTAVLPLPA